MYFHAVSVEDFPSTRDRQETRALQAPPVSDNLFSQAEGGSMLNRFSTAILFALALTAPAPAQTPTPRAPAEPMKPLYVLEDSYVGWRLQPSEQAYACLLYTSRCV